MATTDPVNVTIELPDEIKQLLDGMYEIVALHTELSEHAELEGDRVEHRTANGWVDTADAIEAILTKERSNK